MTAGAIGGRTGRVASPQGSQRVARPSYGWLTLLLHAVVLAVTANSVVRIDRGERLLVLVPLTLSGMLLGVVVTRLPALDAVSHLLSFALGVLASLGLSAIRLDGVSTTWHRHGGNIVDIARRLVETQANGRAEPLNDNDLLVAIGLTLWLVGYSSAWMLYRRHWLLAALVVPAALVFVSLRFEDAQPVASIAVFAFAAIVMAARHQAYIRQLEWGRMRMAAPSRLPHRFTAAGSVVAVAAMLAGLMLPVQAPNGVADQALDQVQRAWEDVGRRLQLVKSDENGNNLANAGYNQFASSFKIGVPFEPSPEIVATLQADAPEYLAARRYDIYNGRYWVSGVDQTFRMEGDAGSDHAIPVRFGKEQFVTLSPDVSARRDRTAGVVTLVADTGGQLLTTGIYVAASEATVAQLGWIQLPERRIDIEAVDVSSLPVDLQALVAALKRAEFSPNASGRPAVVDAEQAGEIERLRADLLRYPVETALSYGDDENVVLTISGRIPNYDDIEEVRSADAGGSSRRYSVTGSRSQASAEELEAAGTDYPDWVRVRYLQVPDTVTSRTTALASQIAQQAGAETPYDVAVATTDYLKNTYAYALNSEQTPDGQDAVDFFLFGKRIGRCEEFATSLAVMLRTQGIPARLVSGYRSGDEVDQYGDYVYRGLQAHTWVEVFFPKYGWVPFEATPNMPGFDQDRPQRSQVAPSATAEPLVEPTPTVPAEAARAEASPTPAPPASTTDDDNRSMKDRLRNGVALAMLLVTAGVALAVTLMAIAWAWGLRGLSPAASLFARVQRVGRLWGVEPNPSMTPAEYAAEFGQAVPRATRPVQIVAGLYAAEQYGGVDIGDDARDGGEEAWKSVRAVLRSWRPWRRRRHGR